MKMGLTVFAAIGALSVAMPASAALLNGHKVQLTYRYPDLGNAYDGPYNNIVGTTGTTTFSNGMAVTPADQTVSYTFPGNVFGPAAFNGVQLFDVDGTIADFTSVKIDPSSTFAGFDPSRISFDANNIWVNFQGLTVVNNSTLVLDINQTAPGVPEPATWALMLGGFGLVGAAMRKRSSSNIAYA